MTGSGTADQDVSAGGEPRPPAGMKGKAGPFFRLVRDQRVAFLIVGTANTAIGFAWFLIFQLLLRDRFGYMVVLLCAHVASVLCAFVLYRNFVFRVNGHVLRDLWRFEVINLSSLGINAALLPLFVEVAGLPVLLAQLASTAVTVVVSFFGHRGFSFRRTPTHTVSADQRSGQEEN